MTEAKLECDKASLTSKADEVCDRKERLLGLGKVKTLYSKIGIMFILIFSNYWSLISVVPKFEETFKAFDATLPLNIRVLFSISHFLKSTWGMMLFPIFIGVITALVSFIEYKKVLKFSKRKLIYNIVIALMVIFICFITLCLFSPGTGLSSI